ncbi:anaerobic C4-dicarboxylate transporter family protein [Prevotella sp. kh1p2]|uniref:anaerobic C4-dicarboxylate transporter family protein n=1 Tax=Prevotella sp. kh1p2 TaxID=1761883 RepID=UPI0008CC76DC|nr:anaerobic C4-dicarboxylate transporter [Prevotella sp. kh1p2]SES92091.1 anaerobic C4-dicarboxylate transporter DcuA [Prevotella sp. kh1p2]SNU11160.1 anaerobic C4-dicarboxylate transporter DcuA [Prevotellaceae bacterium KH2P17]
MATTLILLQLVIVLAFIFIGARVGGIGMGIYGMVGTFFLVFVFGLPPGKAPIDVMLIIASVIVAAAALQATGGLDYLVGVTGRFLRNHPDHITYYGPLACWLFCILAGTAHTSYSLLPIISEIAQKNKIRPERPLSVSVIAASLGITGSPVSAATAAIISTDILGAKGIGLADVILVCVPASLISILVAAFVQNHVGKELADDPVYKAKVASGEINPEEDAKLVDNVEENANPRAKYAVLAFLLGVAMVVVYGFFPELRPHFMVDGVRTTVATSEMIEIVMMSVAALILIVGRGSVKEAVKGNIFAAGMNAMISIFGIAWMGDTFFKGNQEFFVNSLGSLVQSAPFLFAVVLFVMSIMLFSQAATVRTIYPLGIMLGINPLFLLAMFPACNGYFFLPTYPTEVAAINFDKTGTTHIGKYVVNHSFQLSGFITTFVSIGLAFLATQLFY